MAEIQEITHAYYAHELPLVHERPAAGEAGLRRAGETHRPTRRYCNTNYILPYIFCSPALHFNRSYWPLPSKVHVVLRVCCVG